MGINLRQTTRLVLVAAGAGLLVCGAQPASASTIEITGGFTSYQGPAGCGQFSTVINGVDVTPTAGCDPLTLTAPITADLGGTVESVDFFGLQFGSSLTPNQLTFTPADPQTIENLGDEVLLGVLEYTNGTWFGTGPVALFGFQLTTSSSDPAFDNHVLFDYLIMDITPTSSLNTAAENADFLYFTGYTAVGSFRVYERFDSPTGSNTGRVDVYGRISSIVPTRFANVQGAAFLDPGIATQPTAVPEPATVLLLGSAVVAALLRRRRPETPRNGRQDTAGA